MFKNYSNISTYGFSTLWCIIACHRTQYQTFILSSRRNKKLWEIEAGFLIQVFVSLRLLRLSENIRLRAKNGLLCFFVYEMWTLRWQLQLEKDIFLVGYYVLAGLLLVHVMGKKGYRSEICVQFFLLLLGQKIWGQKIVRYLMSGLLLNHVRCKCIHSTFAARIAVLK